MAIWILAKIKDVLGINDAGDALAINDAGDELEL